MLNILALLLTTAIAFSESSGAKIPSPKAKRSGASSMMDPMDFSSCVKESIQGSKEGKCSANEETPSCLGLRKSLEYFREKKTCMQWRGPDCQEWGTHGKTQAQWMSIAAGHLSKFGVCVRKRYGSDDDNGIKAAAADDQLLQALKKMQDGGSILGLREGELLPLILGGDRFSVILQSVPIADDYKAHDYFRIKDAADNPAKIEFINLSEEEYQARRASHSSGDDPFAEFIDEYQSTESVAAETLDEAKPNIVANRLEVSPEQTRNPANISDVTKPKAVVNNPYTLGLDRSLFERISTVYQKRAHEFRSVDDLVKGTAPPARDFREMLNRGETL